jgi:hypothetical protein
MSRPARWSRTLLCGLGVAGGSLLLLAAAPSHVAAQQAVQSPHGTLPDGLQCSACHTAEGWSVLRKPLAFKHGAKTGFFLTGAHTSVACTSCHTHLGFDGPVVKQNECASCHTDVHQGRMLQDCAECHSTTSFRQVDGQRIHARTSFPLTGAHRQLTCEACHVTDAGGAFSRVDPECASCHMKDYQGARTVNHLTSGFPTTCTVCHNTLTWNDTRGFDHASVARGYALIGAHAIIPCASCHRAGDMAPLFTPANQNDCVTCHQPDYDRAHSGTSFPTTCLSCHDQSSWKNVGSFDHGLTGFQLQGAHASLACSSCHASDGTSLLFPKPASQQDCVACHQADYNREHAGSGFPTTCLSCHNQSSWGNATVDHAALSGGFQLVGAHTTLACTACHAVPGYTLLFPKPASQNDCVTCHQTQFNSAHGGQGYPNTCAMCHTVSAWTPSTFDHDSQYFPIYSGTHQGRWSTCADCHTVPSDFSSFSCLTCHSQSSTDPNHTGVKGYVYASSACYSCHRNGGGG